jgi:hypothetical protein
LIDKVSLCLLLKRSLPNFGGDWNTGEVSGVICAYGVTQPNHMVTMYHIIVNNFVVFDFRVKVNLQSFSCLGLTIVVPEFGKDQSNSKFLRFLVILVTGIYIVFPILAHVNSMDAGLC